MKKITIIITCYVILGILLLLVLHSFLPLSLFGYYGKISWAREAEELYIDVECVFSSETAEEVVDFVIKGNTLNIVKIACRKNLVSRKSYCIDGFSTYYLDKIISDYRQTNECNWITDAKWFSKTEVKWCIESVSSDLYDKSDYSFEFNYNGEEYRLCYQING